MMFSHENQYLNRYSLLNVQDSAISLYRNEYFLYSCLSRLVFLAHQSEERLENNLQDTKRKHLMVLPLVLKKILVIPDHYNYTHLFH